jgi:hypothetical protein
MATPPGETSAAVRERLDTMKQAARAHERTGVEFTAADINALIAANRKSRGMASVGIDGNVAQVLFSIPRAGTVTYAHAMHGEMYTDTVTAPDSATSSNATLARTTCRPCAGILLFRHLSATFDRNIRRLRFAPVRVGKSTSVCRC